MTRPRAVPIPAGKDMSLPAQLTRAQKRREYRAWHALFEVMCEDARIEEVRALEADEELEADAG